MFLIDDILLSPARGLFMIFRELHEAAEQEFASEAENIRTQLSELYLLLESGQLAEHDFDEREKVLLDRLDELEAMNEAEDDEDDSEPLDEEDDTDIEVGAQVEE